jgi:hypothetical protein
MDPPSNLRKGRGRPKKSTPQKKEAFRQWQQKNRSKKRAELKSLEVEYALGVERGVSLADLEDLRLKINALKKNLSSARESAWFAKTPEAVKRARQSQSSPASALHNAQETSHISPSARYENVSVIKTFRSSYCFLNS